MHLYSLFVEAGAAVLCTYTHWLKGWGQQYCAPILTSCRGGGGSNVHLCSPVVEVGATVMCTYAHQL